TFGESANLGFYFENIGYYFGISDNFDLLLAADIYTRGSWAIKTSSNYIFRYKCNGKLDLSFNQTYFGERLIDSTFYHSNDFKLYWDHKQDPKSHPTTRFAAHIDIVSRNYNKYTSSSISDYLSNQYTSNINFSTNAKGIFYLDAAVSYSQNVGTQQINIKLPDLNMSVNQFYPFRKKGKLSALKWYDNISMQWNSQFISQINTYDTLFFQPETWEKMEVGMRHSIPINIPIKIAKLINWNTSINLTEKWYLQKNGQEFTTDTIGGNIVGQIDQIFKRNFYALHDISLNTSLTTKIFFTYQFKKGGLKAIRHVMTPNLNFTYTPAINGQATGKYFNTITGQEVDYSYFSGSIFGGANEQTIASTQLSLNNNIEIKVRSKKDTITGTKKIVIFDNLSLSMGYNFAADSLRWSHFRISGRSSIIKQLYITFNFAFDPYSIDHNGNRINKTELKLNKRLFRFSASDINIGLNLTLNRDLFKGKKKSEGANPETPPKNDNVFTTNSLGMPNTRPDFNNPWSFTINYSFAYSTSDNYKYYQNQLESNKYNNNIIQTLNIIGEFSITKKWKIGFTTGYDFVQKALSYTSLDIYRDLHCWEMRFNWIPIGYRKGWSFTINVKASVLKDLKYNMKQDFRDNL
ncbi:MAG: putative LPS assembly protein LptD, partial [Bacteroidales bacterium]